ERQKGGGADERMHRDFSSSCKGHWSEHNKTEGRRGTAAAVRTRWPAGGPVKVLSGRHVPPDRVAPGVGVHAVGDLPQAGEIGELDMTAVGAEQSAALEPGEDAAHRLRGEAQ